jgi:hypothetical protein
MIKVYHNNKFLDFSFASSDQEPDTNECKLIALVDTDSLDKAFELTNHIDGPWEMNTGVCVVGFKHRSTSVGDVMYDGKEFWMVDTIGFRMLKNWIKS